MRQLFRNKKGSVANDDNKDDDSDDNIVTDPL